LGIVKMRCYKCGKIGHKYRVCPLWKRRERMACVARLQKIYQQKELACPTKEEAQEKRLRRTEEEKTVYVAEL